MHTERELAKSRKSAVEFKCRRSQLNKKKISDTSKKEAKEGKTYANLSAKKAQAQVNYSELSTTELSNITKQHQQEYENSVPKYTLRLLIEKKTIDDNNSYNFVLFNTETTSTGKSAELCQLAALDRSGHQFLSYVLPNRDIDSYASKVNKLTVKTLNGNRVLCKENQAVTTSTH